jgi:ferredoxin
MIVAERKPFDEITDMIKGYEKILVAGCGTCVAVCLAGGEKEVAILSMELQMALKNSDNVGSLTLERQCDMEYLDEIADKINNYDAILSTACGAGVQFMAERYPDKPILPALNTTFIGVNKEMGWYEERCRSCGNCLLGMTGGVCPITMCSKGLLNGPCGGTNQSSCEIDPNQPCAWYMIYERLSKQNRLDNILTICPPNDWRDQVPRTVIQPAYKERNAEVQE